jgi:hypothetical protein
MNSRRQQVYVPQQQQQTTDLNAIYKQLRNADPRLNPTHAESPERLQRAKCKVEMVLTVLDKRLRENQYILIHARDVYKQLELVQQLLKLESGQVVLDATEIAS